MRSLASATGGLAIVNNNDVTAGFARIVSSGTTPLSPPMAASIRSPSV
jgi:hypothetical protein